MTAMFWRPGAKTLEIIAELGNARVPAHMVSRMKYPVCNPEFRARHVCLGEI